MTVSIRSFEIQSLDSKLRRQFTDQVAVEEPLEIRLRYGPEDNRKSRSLAVTMRTPGNDFELAIGFLISEGIVRRLSDVSGIHYLSPFLENRTDSNLVEVELDPQAQFELSKVQRHFYLSSSCGICGKASLDAIRADQVEPFDRPDDWKLDASVIFQLGNQLRSRQAVFQVTGGLHGAGLVSAGGQWLAIREDVGRHNAVDKLIGSQFWNQNFPIDRSLLVLSGRASFELMQKALLARIAIVIAIGAPSSLAIELAAEFGMTLIGFASDQRFNLYTGGQRIVS